MYNLSDLISVSWHVRFPVELTMLAPGTAYMAEVSALYSTCGVAKYMVVCTDITSTMDLSINSIIIL